VVLYFGTGGTPETSTTAQNEFYAVYGDTGDIRTKMTPAAGVRFFGSATYNSGQIVFTRGEDVSSVDPCTPTSGEIVAIDAATFSEQFVLETNGTITAPMFASGGEILRPDPLGQDGGLAVHRREERRVVAQQRQRRRPDGAAGRLRRGPDPVHPPLVETGVLMWRRRRRREGASP
jgi:hypothetical protein